jgi:hypothetical protein
MTYEKIAAFLHRSITYVHKIAKDLVQNAVKAHSSALDNTRSARRRIIASV